MNPSNQETMTTPTPTPRTDEVEFVRLSDDCTLVNSEFARELERENVRLVALLREVQEALDVLADDAEDAGYPARAEAAADLAMRCRQALQS